MTDITRDDIVTEVQSTLGFTLTTTTRVKLAEVQRWIDQYHGIAVATLAQANLDYYSAVTDTWDSAVDDGDYDLSSEATRFLVAKRLMIRYNDGDDLVLCTPIDLNDLGGDPDPNSEQWSQAHPIYWIWGKLLNIRPIPDEDSSAWTTDAGEAFKLWQIPEPDDLGASDVPKLPTTFQHILAYPVVARSYRQMGKMEKANVYDNPVSDEYPKGKAGLWQVHLQALIAKYGTRDKVKPLYFRIRKGPYRKHGIFRPKTG